MATGTVTAATGFDATADQVSGEEKAVTIAAPIIGGLLFYGAVELFNASSASSTGADDAAQATAVADSLAAAKECNIIIGAWNDERGAAASAAAIRFQKQMDELNKEVEKIRADAAKASGAGQAGGNVAARNGAAGQEEAAEKEVAPPAAAE